MSTRTVRSLPDFIRHRMDVEVACACGHKAVFSARQLYDEFAFQGWSMSLSGFGDSMFRHFRCTKCGKRPVRIGPGGR